MHERGGGTVINNSNCLQIHGLLLSLEIMSQIRINNKSLMVEEELEPMMRFTNSLHPSTSITVDVGGWERPLWSFFRPSSNKADLLISIYFILLPLRVAELEWYNDTMIMMMLLMAIRLF